MIILIDGYNLLRNIFHKEKGKLTKQREELVKQLSHYKKKKKHEVVIVFDGGLFNHASREIRGGVVVIFSGQRSIADDWIYDFSERNKEKEIMLVSEDRSLVDKCRRFGVDGLKTHDFYNLLQDSLLEDVKEELLSKGKAGDVCKYEREDDENLKEIDSEALDILLAQSDMRQYQKDDKEESSKPKKGSSRKMTKEEKKIYKKIKKL